MKLSDFKNEDAIDLLADIMEPAVEIMADPELRTAIATQSKIAVARLALKRHKHEVLEILARLDGKTVENYSCNPATVVMDIVSILNDKELTDFFTSQANEMLSESSTLPAENTTEKDK